MARTLLTEVNAVLRRVREIAGDSGAITSLSDSARQPKVDAVVSYWNDAVQQLYTIAERPFPIEAKVDQITLQTNTREYAMPQGWVKVRWPLINEANGYTIEMYPAEHDPYEKMRHDQLQPAQWTGRPNFAVIEPVNGNLRMDRAPTAAEDGLVYTILFDRKLDMTQASDTFPLSDEAVNALEGVVAELYRRDFNGAFDAAMVRTSYSRAARFLNPYPDRDRW